MATLEENEIEKAVPLRARLPRFMRDFLATEASSGLVMLIFAALALLAANSPWAEIYKTSVAIPISFGLDELSVTEPLKIWVKDILMVLFFLVIGLELKHEMREGFLREKAQIILPLLAAAGGMALPAVAFLMLTHPHPELHAGWAIPSATDIAFALCVLMLIGKGRIPPAVKVFLLAIAIFDDLGAILIIALFYSGELALQPLALAGVGVAVLAWLNIKGVSTLAPYMFIGVFLWFCLYHSGIHTTVAGVIVGMAIPMRCGEDGRRSPLNKAMHLLHPWVSFIVLPIFAFTSAGVSFKGMSFESLLEPLPFGIALGLFFGKQLGIFGMTWIAIKLKLAKLPQGADWLYVYGVAIIAGIGFTMSLFIGMLAFEDTHLQEMVKLGVISGSLLSAVWGAFIFTLAIKRNPYSRIQPNPIEVTKELMT